MQKHIFPSPRIRLQYPCIHLETYAICNARCVFCGYKDMTRTKGVMSDKLLNNIIDDLSSWENPPHQIVPIHYGEFFLNPKWLYILQQLQDKLPNTKIAIPTNGSMFTTEMIDELVKIKTFEFINFSVYGYFDDTYKRLIGLPTDTISKVEQTVINIHKERPDVRIGVSTVNHPPFITTYETESFLAKWRPFGIAHCLVANHSINKKLMKTFSCRIPCNGVLTALIVLWDGKVCLCCYDPNGELYVGNVKTEKLLDIWNGPKVRNYQRLHLKGERDKISLCKTCTSC